MSIANKLFKNNNTGELIKVIDSFENIAILENKQKIDVRTLMDPNQYTEQIDPNNFFNNQGAYNILADKIKNIPTHLIKDENDNININADINNDFYPNSNESAIVMTTEEDEKAELARKYGASIDNTNTLKRQNDAFAKILGDTDELPEVQEFNQVNVNIPEVEVQRVEVQREDIKENTRQQTNVNNHVVVDDPIITMFKKTKRNVEFKVNFDFNDKIPRLDFIEMMEDSYETSMIDFLADEFTNKILKDPSIIRETIKSKIKQLVYGGEVTKVNDQITDSVTQVNSQITDSVTTRIDQSKNDVSFNDKTGQVKLEKPKTTRKPRAKKETVEK
jgi:hypothetical protein